MDLYMQSFKVTGYGAFPFDMLRYDECWPACEAETGLFCAGPRQRLGRRTIALRRYVFKHDDLPTEERWRSFGWSVEMGSLVTEYWT